MLTMVASSTRASVEALLPRRRVPDSSEGARTVQLSVRLATDLRDAVRSAAERSDMTLTDFVEQALRAEVVRHTDPAAQFTERLAESIRTSVVAALDDGSWDEAVRALTATDPDLAVDPPDRS
jgi:uncharacterized protein (DUF1778 family)